MFMWNRLIIQQQTWLKDDPHKPVPVGLLMQQTSCQCCCYSKDDYGRPKSKGVNSQIVTNGAVEHFNCLASS